VAPARRSGAPLLNYEVTERTGSEASLLLHGQLSGEVSAERLKEDLGRHYVDDGVRIIVVDLSGLDLIDLEGVGVLLTLWREARQRGKRLFVQGANGQVREKLAITGVLGPLGEEGSAPG